MNDKVLLNLIEKFKKEKIEKNKFIDFIKMYGKIYDRDLYEAICVFMQNKNIVLLKTFNEWNKDKNYIKYKEMEWQDKMLNWIFHNIYSGTPQG